MSKKAKSSKNVNIGRKFRIFVKPVDDCGYPDESRFGWISRNEENRICLRITQSSSIVFEEKENGHGSFEDWKKFFEEEYSDWRIMNGPSYLSSEPEE